MNIPIEKIKSKRILVIGDLMLDIYLRGKASRISPEAPVPIVSAESQDRIPGGSANVMANLRALGCEVVGVGFVGDDDEGRFLRKTLESLGVQTSGIIATTLPTIHKTRVLANGQHVVRFDFDTDFSRVTRDKRLEILGYIEVLNKIYRSFDAVIISDYCKGTIDRDVVEAIKQNFSCPVIVDTKPQHKNYFHGVWCITPNFDEAKQMIGHWEGNDPFYAAQILKEEMSLQTIIITLADRGVLLINEDNKEVLFDAYAHVDEHDPTQRFDVTGAGDTVISVFAACVSAGIAARDAVYAANIAAGIVVKKTGTAFCSYDELEHHLDD